MPLPLSDSMAGGLERAETVRAMPIMVLVIVLRRRRAMYCGTRALDPVVSKGASEQWQGGCVQQGWDVCSRGPWDRGSRHTGAMSSARARFPGIRRRR